MKAVILTNLEGAIRRINPMMMMSWDEAFVDIPGGIKLRRGTVILSNGAKIECQETPEQIDKIFSAATESPAPMSVEEKPRRSPPSPRAPK